jgi:hypothetical protein
MARYILIEIDDEQVLGVFRAGVWDLVSDHPDLASAAQVLDRETGDEVRRLIDSKDRARG